MYQSPKFVEVFGTFPIFSDPYFSICVLNDCEAERRRLAATLIMDKTLSGTQTCKFQPTKRRMIRWNAIRPLKGLPRIR
jgi:hypothetical protein